MNIKEFIMPNTLEQAYELMTQGKNNAILGGCCFLRMGQKSINKGIDISNLNLNFIIEKEDTIEIGASTTFREIETNHITNKYFDGILAKSVKHIIGVQLRNLVTVGGTVYSRYGFSDFITALLALDVSVELYKNGRMPLEEFLENGVQNDILVKIIIRKVDRRAAFSCIRNSHVDYAILNCAVSNLGGVFKIVVGARPSRAKVAMKASKFLSENTLTDENILKAVQKIDKDLNFGSNMRASGEYRKEVCKVLVKRRIVEVIS